MDSSNSIAPPVDLVGLLDWVITGLGLPQVDSGLLGMMITGLSLRSRKRPCKKDDSEC